MKKYFVLLVVLFCTGIITAQSYVTHKILLGETIEGIATKYSVTPYNIYKYNPEARGKLVVGNLLVISSASDLESSTINEAKKENKTIVVDTVNKPLHFISHKVRRRDNLFRISKKYDVSVADIKKYNTELYADEIKKGMILNIPVFPAKSEESVEETNGGINIPTEIYIVKPSETSWSIAHKYGISIDSLKVLNPEMGKILPIGQELVLPLKAVENKTPEQEEVTVYTSYIVPEKDNFFQLKQKFGVTEELLKEINPQLKERGLQQGMEIRIPKVTNQSLLVNAENYIFYAVKQGEGFYRLKVKLGYAQEELQKLNPIIVEQGGLKPGMILKIPKNRAIEFNVRNSNIVDNFRLIDSINTQNRPSIALMLPFRINEIDFSSNENIKRKFKGNVPLKYSLGLYTGALVALDSIKKLGITTDVVIFDTEMNIEKSRELLLDEQFNNIKAVIGPLNGKLFSELAPSFKSKNIPVFSPFSSGGEATLDNVFYSVPSDEVLSAKMVNFIAAKIKSEQLMIITDKTSEATKELLLKKFPKAVFLTPKSLDKKIDYVLPLFSNKVENWVLIATNDVNTLSTLTTVLNSVNSDKRKIKLFTTKKGSIYEKVSNSYLSNMNLHYPSATKRSTAASGFKKMYKEKFGKSPDRFATRGFDLTMDVLLRLAYKSTIFEASNSIGETEYIGSKFSYSKDLYKSYYNTSTYLMMYEDMRIKEVVYSNEENENGLEK